MQGVVRVVFQHLKSHRGPSAGATCGSLHLLCQLSNLERCAKSLDWANVKMHTQCLMASISLQPEEEWAAPVVAGYHGACELLSHSCQPQSSAVPTSFQACLGAREPMPLQLLSKSNILEIASQPVLEGLLQRIMELVNQHHQQLLMVIWKADTLAQRGGKIFALLRQS